MTTSDTIRDILEYVTNLDRFGVYVVDELETSWLLIDESLSEVVAEAFPKYDNVAAYVRSGVLHVDATDPRYPSVVPAYRIYPVKTRHAEPVIYKYMDERYGTSWSVPDRNSRELCEELKSVSSRFPES